LGKIRKKTFRNKIASFMSKVAYDSFLYLVFLRGSFWVFLRVKTFYRSLFYMQKRKRAFKFLFVAGASKYEKS